MKKFAIGAIVGGLGLAGLGAGKLAYDHWHAEAPEDGAFNADFSEVETPTEEVFGAEVQEETPAE